MEDIQASLPSVFNIQSEDMFTLLKKLNDKWNETLGLYPHQVQVGLKIHRKHEFGFNTEAFQENERLLKSI